MLPRVILLDIDGVLHPLTSATHFDASCMGHLRTIVEATGASIVLSSSWQSSECNRLEAQGALARWGLPPFSGRTVRTVAGVGALARATEIWEWVQSNAERVAGGWVALDDLDLCAEGVKPFMRPKVASALEGHFVRTAADRGLAEADAARAIELLGGRDSSAPKLVAPAAAPEAPRSRAASRRGR